MGKWLFYAKEIALTLVLLLAIVALSIEMILLCAIVTVFFPVTAFRKVSSVLADGLS